MSNSRPDVLALILAAGKGKRMRSRFSKVMHHLSGRPMLDHVLDTLDGAGIEKLAVITGYGEDQVKGHLGDRADCITQEKQLGTGHAVMQADSMLADFQGLVLITYGDTPLWRADTIRDALDRANEPNTSGVVLTMRLDDPTGYGRVIRGAKGHVQKIVEQKDATEAEQLVAEVNSGTYCFRGELLREALKELSPNNAQGEYYLTDVIEILIRKGHRILAHEVADPTEAMGVNSRIDLAAAEQILQRRTLDRLMENGVTVVDPKSTWVDSRVEVGQDTILLPNTVLRGFTVIGEGCRIGPNTELSDARIGPGTTVRHSVIEGMNIENIEPGQQIGPFAWLVHSGNGSAVQRGNSPTRLGSGSRTI